MNGNTASRQTEQKMAERGNGGVLQYRSGNTRSWMDDTPESNSVGRSDIPAVQYSLTQYGLFCFSPVGTVCVTSFFMTLKLVLRITISTGIVQHSAVHCFCFMRSFPVSLFRLPIHCRMYQGMATARAPICKPVGKGRIRNFNSFFPT